MQEELLGHGHMRLGLSSFQAASDRRNKIYTVKEDAQYFGGACEFSGFQFVVLQRGLRRLLPLGFAHREFRD